MEKVILVAFQGEPMCFVHVLLNAIEMHEKGFKSKIIIEGAACKLVKELNDPTALFSDMYEKAKDMDLIEGVCKACAAKMGSLESAKEQKLDILDSMHGHPSLAKYIDMGYKIITF